MGSKTWELFKTIETRTPDNPGEEAQENEDEDEDEKKNPGLLIKPPNENTLAGKIQVILHFA